jgi:dihydropteroate synthase
VILPERRFYIVPLAHGGTLRLGDRPLVMAILNVTSDSFAESVPRRLPDAAAALALEMASDGADIIDIGGESTRPGAEPVSADEELARVLPVLRTLAGRVRVPISIDTSKADVARAAVAAGASIVNDVSGLRFDPALARAVAEGGAALVLMHSRGRPQTMGDEAVYGDVAAEVTAELRDSLRRAAEAGVALERTVVDPGIGFAKRPSHSYGVLARLPELAAALDRPVLVGPSRKSFLRDAVGGRPAADRDWGTAAAVTAAVLAGAHIVRVHAVAEMAQVVRVAEEIRRHHDMAHGQMADGHG